ncbi:hypothetical protein [Streptomyces sp. SLBN-118]|nr:hypothetical protein [Streptomyces sp. SLBN-118]
MTSLAADVRAFLAEEHQ